MPRKSSKKTNQKRNIKNPCGICTNPVPVATNHKAVLCDLCNFWIHIKCNNTSGDKYERLQLDDDAWFCQKCFNQLVPFGGITHEDLKLTLQGKNFDFFLDPDNDVNIQFYRDIEDSLDQDDNSNIDCPYLALSQVNEKYNKNKPCISAIHLNIATLDLHFGELSTILQNCTVPFNFIGIIETGFKDKTKAKAASSLENYNHFDCCTKT